MTEEKLSGRVAQDMKRYVELRIDDTKLAAVEGLSSVAGSAIGLVIGLFLANLALVLFTAVFVYLINLLVHSWVWSAVIMGFIYLIVAAVVVLRPGMFRNMMVKVFAPIFFCNHKYEDYDDYE